MEREHRLHPIVEAAGTRGELPDWARCEGRRYDHAERVADLLDRWARTLGLSERERIRWRAGGYLHDALKGVPPEDLRGSVEPGWPDPVLHAPACAARLREEGVRDEELLLAVAYHSVGHPQFGDLGECLFLADFLDPGRRFLDAERARLRDRLPAEKRDVLQAVLAYRLERLLRRRRAVMPSSVQLWNRLVAP